MRIRQDAFAVPFRGLGVHSDVARSLGVLGESAAACLGGQGKAASSSLLSDEVTAKGRLQNDRSRWR